MSSANVSPWRTVAQSAGHAYEHADDGLSDVSRPERVNSSREAATAEEALWFALCIAPDEGTEVGVLLILTGMSRPTLYRHLREHALAGRAVQVSRGHWRARIVEDRHYE